jgi:hypothetical protein
MGVKSGDADWISYREQEEGGEQRAEKNSETEQAHCTPDTETMTPEFLGSLAPWREPMKFVIRIS